MKIIKYIAFFSTFPLIAAIAFDLFLSLGKDPFEIVLSTPGYIWTQNHPASYARAAVTVPPAAWDIITTILAQKTIFVTAFIAAFFYLIVLIGKLKGTFLPSKKKGNFSGDVSRGDSIVGRKNQGSFQYKRK